MRMLDHLTLLSAGDLIPYAEALTGSMGLLLGPSVPRRIPQTLNKLWMVLNSHAPQVSMINLGLWEGLAQWIVRPVMGPIPECKCQLHPFFFTSYMNDIWIGLSLSVK